MFKRTTPRVKTRPRTPVCSYLRQIFSLNVACMYVCMHVCTVLLYFYILIYSASNCCKCVSINSVQFSSVKRWPISFVTVTLSTKFAIKRSLQILHKSRSKPPGLAITSISCSFSFGCKRHVIASASLFSHPAASAAEHPLAATLGLLVFWIFTLHLLTGRIAMDCDVGLINK